MDSKVWRSARLLALAAVALTIASCGGGGDTLVSAPVASVRIDPASLTLDPGQSAPLNATPLDAAGVTLSGRSASWQSSNSAIAVVSGTGVVTAISDGIASITATVEGRAGSAVVTVRSSVASVSVTPATAELQLGAAPLQLTAIPRTASGAEITNRPVQWNSSSNAIATVSSTGQVTAVSSGTATITATVEQVSGSATVQVMQDPCTVIRTLQIGQVFNGQLAAADCRLNDNTAIQAFDFTLAARTTVEIVMNSNQVDPYLFLADANLNVIDEDDDGGPGLNARILRSLPAGRYVVIANTYAAGSFGAYQLQVRQAPAACVAGSPVALPSSIDALLTASSCLQRDASFENRYSVTVGAAATLQLDMTSTQIDPFLIVMDDDEQVVAQDDDSGDGLNARIEVQLEPGTYTVLARGLPGEVGPYRLTIAPAVDKCAVNNTLVVGQTVSATLSSSDCAFSDGGGPTRFLQRFLLTLASAQPLQLDMTSTAVDAYLVLQDAQTGNVLAENDDVAPGNTNARISANFPAGTYIVNTTTFGTGEVGPYQLSLQPIQNTNVAVAVSPQTLSMQSGQTQQLNSTVTGTGNTAVTWSSSAPNVATVSGTGLVRAITPGTASITVTSVANPARTATATVTVGQSGPTTNLDIAAMYLVQSVQQLDHRVPLVAGRSAVARVFVRGSRTGIGTVSVRVRILEGQTVLGTFTGSTTPTMTLNEGCCSANIPIPGTAIRAGMTVIADVDPDNQIPESNESDNQFPISGTPMPVTVVDVPQFTVRLLPIAQHRNGQVGAANESLFNILRSVWPLGSISATVRQPLVIDYVIGTQNFNDWIRLVRDVEIVRQIEGGASYYYGLVRTTGTSGVLGLANGIPARTAIGVDEGSDFGPAFSRETFAHEMGHLFGLRHAPCGGAAGPDPQYPFPDGRSGVFGMDVFGGNVVKMPEGSDIMTYCPNQWVSAYNYRKVLDFRQANPTGAGLLASRSALLVSGGVANGAVTVDPAFSITASPAAEDPTGRFVIEAFDEDNQVLFSWRFSPYRVHDAGDDTEAFVVVVPVEPTVQEQVARLVVRELSGAKSGMRHRVLSARSAQMESARLRTTRRSNTSVTASWSPSALPAVVVRDRRTGEVLAMLRNGEAELSRFGALDRIELLLSDGVKSTRVALDPATGEIVR